LPHSEHNREEKSQKSAKENYRGNLARRGEIPWAKKQETCICERWNPQDHAQQQIHEAPSPANVAFITLLDKRKFVHSDYPTVVTIYIGSFTVQKFDVDDAPAMF